MNRLLLILFAILLITCSKPKEIRIVPISASKIIKINIAESRPYKQSELFDSVRYVRLEAGKHLLGEVKKIKKFRNQYYIQCDNGVFVFYKSGKFLIKVGNKGDGEGKYKVLTDFLVDTLTNSIEILDRRNQKILSYNLVGLFLNEWRFSLNAQSFSKYDKDTYIFYCSNLINIKNKQHPYRVIVVSKNSNKIVSKGLQIDQHRSNFISYSDVSNFVTYDKSLLFTLSACDTIYDVSVTGISPRYFLDFGVNRIPIEFFDKDFEDVSYFDRALEKTKYAGLFNNFLVENDHALVTMVRYGKEKHLMLHSKINGITHTTNRIIDDILFAGSEIRIEYKIQPKGASENEIYNVVEPSIIIDAIDSLKLKMSEKELSKLMLDNISLTKLSKDLTIIDNPILQISKLKSF